MSQPTADPTGRPEHKTVIVTGGAGGIGLATARALAARGDAVVVVDIDPEAVEAAVAELEDLGGPPPGHLGLRVDVRDEAAVEGMARATLHRYGRIDALVACAGVLRRRGTPPKPLTATTAGEWDEVIAVNLRGTFLCDRAVLPAMVRQRSGMIINLSSVSALEGRANDAAYCASKFGVNGLSQSVADEVRGHGVKVVALMPDAVDTPFWEQNHPVPKPGLALPPERVAALILFLLDQPADTVLLNPVIAPLGARRRRGSRNAAGDAPPAGPEPGGPLKAD